MFFYKTRGFCSSCHAKRLAELVGVTRKTINTVERGHFFQSTVLALKIVKIFGVPFEEVFFLSEE